MDYSYKGLIPGVKEEIIDMTLNASWTRDISRVKKISPETVMNTIKKQETSIVKVNQQVINEINKNKAIIKIVRLDELESALESELDEMWSYVENKTNQRWLWYAIDHNTGKILAFEFGRRKNSVFRKLKKLLEPFGITKFFTDDWGAYECNLAKEQHVVGKIYTQRIERKNLTLRTRIKRLVRKTICFSKTENMHDIVISLFINRYEFNMAT